MSIVLPLTAVRYAPRSDGDISTRLSPPYDVIDAEHKQRLLSSDRKNFVAIDLPHMPPKAVGPPAAYDNAARTLRHWLESGVMLRDADPAIYAYHQSFSFAGRDFTRKMFFARIRLQPFGTGGIFPHEQTFGGPKEDRLALTKATSANLSPIFGLFEDGDHAVAAQLAARLGPQPLAVGDLDGVRNELWAVTDSDALAGVGALMKAKPIYIADGHHRYGTAMMYRDWLVDRSGELPDSHPANFVLCVLCAMEDPGLLILPTHRVLTEVRGLPVDTFKSDAGLTVHELDVASADEVPATLATFGPQAIALFSASDRRYFAIAPTSPRLMQDAAPDKSDAWRGLGLALLHSYLIEKVLAPKCGGAGMPSISYIKSAAAAVALASESGGACFLMQATTMRELRAVCNAGELMPQKSTYFYPKLASGMVVNPLDA